MKKGFTLNEILILAGMLAVLAAIAVPNFMEASVRSKVARARRDLRTLSLAVCAYQADNGRPPLGIVEIGMLYYGSFNSNTCIRPWVYKFLTTPVAYLSSLPDDPFANPPVRPNGIMDPPLYYINTYAAFDYGEERMNMILFAKGFKWASYSLGPCEAEVSPWFEDMLSAGSTPYTLGNMYDPTNGTVSKGKIYQTNKGPLIPPF